MQKPTTNTKSKLMPKREFKKDLMDLVVVVNTLPTTSTRRYDINTYKNQEIELILNNLDTGILVIVIPKSNIDDFRNSLRILYKSLKRTFGVENKK